MWNPILELLCHVRISNIIIPLIEDIGLAKIALTCHFALDLLRYKEEALSSGTIA